MDVCPMSDVAHCPQNFAWGGFAKAHCGQRLARGAAHSMQNFIPRECQRRSAGSASMRPPARRYERPEVPLGKPQYRSLIRANGMVCQYSRPTQVSSEKHEAAADVGADEEC